MRVQIPPAGIWRREESGEYPVCPKCGGLMLNVPEEKLTGEQWADLGVFWSRQEEEDTGGRSLYCFQKATEARKCLRHDKSGDLSGKRLGA